MSDCNCKCCHDHGAILRAHAGVEDVVRDTAEEAMRESGMMPAVQTQRHSDEFIDEALRQIRQKASEMLRIADEESAGALRQILGGGLLFIFKRAHEALQPVTFADPPDNGIVTSVGEMAGNPSCCDINEHATRRL